MLYEEGYWKFPNEFNPENFLNDQGEFHKPEAFLPFSLGKGQSPSNLPTILFTLLLRPLSRLLLLPLLLLDWLVE